ncbi:MAG TPA: DUF2510 domain-containing protein [Jatrophihabitans sp.]|nr:DUF2510 domain-containing protein [Jatrophihabitans sp.]
MSEVAAGWYPDPAGSPAQRWWDGSRWTDQLQQPYAQQPYAQQQRYGQPGYGPQLYGAQPYGSPYGTQVQRSTWQRNQLSFITMIVGVLYLLLAFEAHFVFIGALPVLLTVRAFNRKEPLAWIAAIVTAVAVIIGIVALTR